MCHDRSDTLGLKSLGNCVLVFLENCVCLAETQAQRTNPGQNFVGKFTKLSKIGFSVECYTTECYTTDYNCQNLVVWWAAGHLPWI